MDRPHQSEVDPREQPLRDVGPVNAAPARHVHYDHPPSDGDTQSPKDLSTIRQTSQKRGNSLHERDSSAGVNGDAVPRALIRKALQHRQKRSMTLPDERLAYLQDGNPVEDLSGLGIDIAARSSRMPTGSPRVSTSSASSDDDSVPGPHPGLGTSLSFRQKRLQSLGHAGPSRYPGMLHIPDSDISPRTISKRRMASTGSSPDLAHRNGSSFASPLTHPIGAQSRLRAIVDTAALDGKEKRRSRSAHSVSSMDDRMGQTRRRSPVVATTNGDGAHQGLQGSPAPSIRRGEDTGTNTPTSIRSPSRFRQNSAASGLIASHQVTRKGSKDSQSSTRGAGADDSMNDEKVDIANTVSRKRKQSEDHVHDLHRRSASTDRMEVMAEVATEQQREPIHESRNGKRKPRALDDLGFEGVVGTSHGEQAYSAEASATLENLLSSIDIANAMRLIQKQTVLPAGVIDSTPMPSARSTVRVSPEVKKQRGQKPSEIFVPLAPPPILVSPNQPEDSNKAATSGHRFAGGHVAFRKSHNEQSSSEDTHSVRSHVPTSSGDHGSRLSASSSMPSGFLGTRRQFSLSGLSSSSKASENGGPGEQAYAKPSAMPDTKHKRSISERFSLSHHLMSHGKKQKQKEVATQPEMYDEAALEARDLASFQERIQSALLELSHHPRAEKLAYLARSYLQGYYSNVYASIRDQAYDQDPILRHDPLAVIRWRKEVRREDAKRRAYDAARTSARALSTGSATGSFDPRKDTSVLSLNSPDVSSQPPSKPLHSAELLNRIDHSDAGKHLKTSPALREWVVTPNETAAYLNCKGVVDRFVPPTQNGASLWGEMLQIERSPSSMTASSTRSRSVTSPSSRMRRAKQPPGAQLALSPSNGSEGNLEPEGNGTDRPRGSADAGDRLAAIKSPLRSIRRRIHTHHDRDPDGQASFTSDTENEAPKGGRRQALLHTAQRLRLKAPASKEDIQEVEYASAGSRTSVTIPERKASDHPEGNGGRQESISESVQALPMPQTRDDTSARSDRFDVMPTEEDDEAYRQRLRTLQSVESSLNRAPEVELESQSLVDEFISVVEVFCVQRRCSKIQDDLDRAKELRAAYENLHPILHGQRRYSTTTTLKQPNGAKLANGKAQDQTDSLPSTTPIDPLNVVKESISDLHERYDAAVRQALEVCQQQDAVQRKASELLPDAEHLLSQIGDQVRKLRAIRESFYTLDALHSGHTPAYYRVIDAGLRVAGLMLQGVLLLLRWAYKTMGVSVTIGNWLRASLRWIFFNLGPAFTSFAFWVALVFGILIGWYFSRR